PDPNFDRGMVHTVAVLFDANAAGDELTDHGGAPPDWQPAPGLGAVPCRVRLFVAASSENGQRPQELANFRVLIAALPTATARRTHRLDSTTLLVWVDEYGFTHRLKPSGAAKGNYGSAAGAAHHYSVSGTEYVA